MNQQRAGVSVNVPGHRAPAVGPEVPFEMLEACHERVQRSLQLLLKLIAHLRRNGHDANAAQAAKDVLRYFNLAAPLHHQDEELHVFPPLIAQKDAELSSLVAQLIREHRAMELAWQKASKVLEIISTDSSTQWLPLDASQTRLLENFAGLYVQHMALEESIVFPQARKNLSAAALLEMSADMVARRTTDNI